jgi:chemotaxis protein methyltransferase CheR
VRIALSATDFERVRALLGSSAGLVFDECRRDSLAYSLGERLTACGLASVEDYLALVSSPRGGAELQALLNEVTIQETHFFRNPPQFRALRQHVLPQLIRRAAAADRRLRIWSAGCSTGEEAYSLAMLVREALPLLDGWDVRIVATDVSTRALEVARAGRYGARALLAAPPDDVARWFVRDGDEYVVRPEVRELVEFRHHNLVTEPVPFAELDESVDLLLCRNVTIYFSRETTRRLMASFHAALADGGYLFLGHSETLWQIDDRFRLVTLGDAFVYRRDVPGAERRSVLPDRRTGDDGLPDGERRLAKVDRRAARLDALARPRVLPFPRRLPEPVAVASAPEPVDPVAEVRAALHDGRYADAAALAAAVSVAEPLRADAYYLHGLALANQGRDAEALGVLRKAVYVDPLAGFAHFLLAGVQARLGDAAGAARSYRAAAESLGRSSDDHVAAELGGRRVGELVELCRQLAGERRA